MSTMLLILKLLPNILTIVTQLEALVSGAKKGAVKKDVAVSLIGGALDVAQQAGGLKPAETEQAKALAGPTVDVVVGALNAAGVLTHGSE